jgi:acyl-homoserine-lactone acylase
MRQKLFFCIYLIISALNIYAQINPANIQIARDVWGVPHIFAPTDAEVAYGLAWANAEDDFGSIQEQLLASQSKLAQVKGKSAAVLDVIAHLIGLQELVDTAYHQNTFSPDFQRVMQGYLAGINAYARQNPDKVWLKGSFPISEKDLLRSYVLGFALFTGMPNELSKILDGRIQKDEPKIGTGSNAIAVSRRRTTDHKTYLAINSHQPLEGPFAWYEVHLNSDEGWNVLGGTLPGFLAIGHGVNENLGWAHTVNHPDFTDVYRLEMNPKNELQYKLDGQWETLQKRTLKLKVKIGFLKLSKKLTFYWSKYGATVKKDGKFYALRFAANLQIQAAEQQYRMNKARNWAEFQAALAMQKLPCFNLVYADRADNIYYLSNGLLPYRNPQYDWRKVLAGNTSATLWEPKYHKISELPQVLNPASGYVFNSNNTPYNATAPTDNIRAQDYDPTMGFITFDNNRSLRMQELFSNYDKISYEDFKTIKYDLTYPSKMYYYFAQNLEDVFHLNEAQYPDIQELIQMLKTWNRRCDAQSEAASIMLLCANFITAKLREEQRDVYGNQLTETEMVAALRLTKSHLQKYFKTIRVPLGELQRHIRGTKSLPMPGGFDTLAAMQSRPDKNGKFKTYQGESYISLVKFSEQGVELETINAYGASANPDSPHYTDQMEYYTQQKTKKMTLNKAEVLKNAQKIYSPK